MNTDWIEILIPILAALLGGFFGAWFQNMFLLHKTNKVRNIAIRGLRVFKKYAKDGQTYDTATSDFNNELNIVEKHFTISIFRGIILFENEVVNTCDEYL